MKRLALTLLALTLAAFAAPDIPAPTKATIAATDAAVARGRGAPVPFVEYEAENAVTNGVQIGPDRRFGQLAAEASGRRAVRLDKGSHSIAFTLDRPANAITLRYAIPDAADGSGIDASIGMFVGGKRIASLALTSRHGWFYGRYPFTNDPKDGKAHHFFDHARLLLDRPLPAGTIVTLKLEAEDRTPWAAIDLADFELVPPPRAQPKGSLSLLDFGADPAGMRESGDALRRAVAAAREAGKPLWIPPGNFHVEGHVHVDRLTIEGAGMWYSVLRGEGLGFYGSAPPTGSTAVVLRDFAVIGEVTERKDHLALSGIGGSIGGGSVIERLWLQHHKVGLWFDGPMDGIRITGLRIFDMTADGLNFHCGVSNAVIEDSFIRGTGDDGLAAWSEKKPNRNLVFRNNTVIAPVLANGIAIYGGRDITVSGNIVADTLTQGGGIHLGNRFKAVPLAGRIDIVDNALIRAGSFDPNWKFGVGAFWFYALDAPIAADIAVIRLDIIDSSEEAVSFIGSSVSGVSLRDARIIRPGGFVATLRSAGAARFDAIAVDPPKAAAILACNTRFRITAPFRKRATAPCGPIDR
ncbi:glycosyl hydrolase family 28-related protein [Sphingomonas sp. LT1P40]|uniref:glycosyl hydrolase family 28-related protein n=1 Tax=Alteristakelama amylovorans TaxID=3096166 RepID=UPI002FC6B475